MKRMLSLLIAVALIVSFVPTFASAEVGDSFNVNIYDWTEYDTDTNQYLSATAQGSNWAIDASLTGEKLICGTKEGGAARLQVNNSTTYEGFKFLTVNAGYGDFVVKFDAPKSGTYRVTANVTPYTGGGTNAEIIVNGTPAGAFSSYATTEDWASQFKAPRPVELGIVRLTEGELTNTLIIRPVLGGAILEGFTFTEIEPVPTEVSIDFPTGVTIGAPDAILSTRFVVDKDETSSFTAHDNRIYTNGSGDKLLQVDVAHNSDSTWIDSKGSKERKFTIKVPITAAGWYDLEFTGGLWYANAGFYIYVNDKYAGFYNFDNATPENPKATWCTGEKMRLNTMYLEPDAEGYAKISFNFAKPSANYSKARMQLINFAITPTETQEKVTCVDIVHTLPTELAYGETKTFSAYAVMSDGTRRRINGYKADATVDAGNTISAKGADGNIHISRTSNRLYDDGVFEGTVSALGIGKQSVVLSVMVDGKEYTETAEINVAPATAPVAFSMGLADDNLVYPDNSIASAWNTMGYSVVFSKTTDSVSRYYPRATYAITQLVTNGGYMVWPGQTTNLRQAVITFKKSVPCAGYYDIDFTGYLWKLCGDYDIYINGEHAGLTNCYDAADALSGASRTTSLNTLYLPEGDVEISFRARNSHYTGAMFFTPKSLDFTPSTVSEIAVSEVKTSDVPETMAAGETYDGTAQAVMNNGLVRSFGYTDNGGIPTEDIIKVSSSNPAVVAVTDVECVQLLTQAEVENAAITIDPTTTTYKLNALRNGEADITITAIVDGKAKTTTKKITVSGNAMEETILKTGAKVYVGTEVGGTVTTSLANIVDEVSFGTEVSASAKASDGYTFAYWADSNGGVLSENANEVFVINTNTSIIAHFEKTVTEADTTAPVYFYNGNGAMLTKLDVEKGVAFKDIESKPSASLTGFAFGGWSIADETVIESVTRAVALFNELDVTYTVSVDDGVYSTSYSGKAYGDSVTVTAKGEDTFSCWMIGDDIVSYNKSFTFSVYGNMKVTAVYGTALTAIPTAALDKVGGSYFLTYNVPAGFEKIEAGILFSESGTPAVGAAYSKAIERTGSGQFTAQPNGDGDTIARGYVMFKDSAGNIKVIYAE